MRNIIIKINTLTLAVITWRVLMLPRHLDKIGVPALTNLSFKLSASFNGYFKTISDTSEKMSFVIIPLIISNEVLCKVCPSSMDSKVQLRHTHTTRIMHVLDSTYLEWFSCELVPQIVQLVKFVSVQELEHCLDSEPS